MMAAPRPEYRAMSLAFSAPVQKIQKEGEKIRQITSSCSVKSTLLRDHEVKWQKEADQDTYKNFVGNNRCDEQ